MRKAALVLTSLALLVPAYTAARDAGACRIVVPTDFSGAPASWLGACPAGLADGLGVIRAGTTEPFRYFAGQARAGRPGRGLIVLKDGFYATSGFDARGNRQDIISGDPNEFHATFVLAIRAAQATAQRFAAAGNRGSAAYYQRLAKKIRDGEPE